MGIIAQLRFTAPALDLRPRPVADGGSSVVAMIEDWSTAPADAAAHFARRLAVETDVSDVAAALSSGVPGFVLLDSRSTEAWDQGHVPGALHLPGREIARYGAQTRGGVGVSVPI